MPDKDLEAWYMDRWLSCHESFSHGEPVPSEEPDFVLETPDGLLGVEITRFFVETEIGSRPLQEQESIRAKVLRKASQLFGETRRPFLQVNVFFSAAKPLSNSDVDHLANALATLVSDLDVAPGEICTLDDHNDPRQKLPAQVLSVMAVGSTRFTKNHWFFDDTALTPEVTTAQIQRILDDKRDKYPVYRRDTTRVWLLIVLDGGGMSSLADFPSATLATSYTSCFDRVFLFINAFSRSIEVKLQRSPVGA